MWEKLCVNPDRKTALAVGRGLGGVIALPAPYIVFQETQTGLAHAQHTQTFILTYRHP
jgi:hypothetical protein